MMDIATPKNPRFLLRKWLEADAANNSNMREVITLRHLEFNYFLTFLPFNYQFIYHNSADFVQHNY